MIDDRKPKSRDPTKNVLEQYQKSTEFQPVLEKSSRYRYMAKGSTEVYAKH